MRIRPDYIYETLSYASLRSAGADARRGRRSAGDRRSIDLRSKYLARRWR
jgi:hypothetical protein